MKDIWHKTISVTKIIINIAHPINLLIQRIGSVLPVGYNLFFIVYSFSQNFQKIISPCGCFFHLDRYPVIYKVEIGKGVEKADVET